jgi:hypothetical protein
LIIHNSYRQTRVGFVCGCAIYSRKQCATRNRINSRASGLRTCRTNSDSNQTSVSCFFWDNTIVVTDVLIVIVIRVLLLGMCKNGSRTKRTFATNSVFDREQKSVRHEQCFCSRTKKCSPRTVFLFTNVEMFVALQCREWQTRQCLAPIQIV